MAQQLITREKFKKIKKMDRRELEIFIYNLYQEAYTDGVKEGKASAPAFDEDELHKRLLEIKGIGKTKTLTIMHIIKNVMEDKKC